MDRNKLEQLLSNVQSGEITVNQALKRLQSLPYENLEYARLQLKRASTVPTWARAEGVPAGGFQGHFVKEKCRAPLQRN